MDPILIVDDEQDNLDALRRLLRSLYEVTVAATPVDALKQVMTKPFHVILSDQRMPNMTGVEFFEKVKNVQPAAIRILLTGYTDIDSVIGAINRGHIYRYIAKPWDPQDLKITLRQANEAFKLNRELENRNSELSHANAELEKANRELQLLDTAKARFLSLVSHELNTPLTVLTSFAPLLTEKQKADEAAKSARAIQSATVRLAEIVQEIVHYISVESNPRLNVSQVEVATLLSEILSELSTRIADKKLKVQTAFADGLVIKADRNRLALALEKLLADFIARAPVGSTLALRSALDGKTTLLSLGRKGDPLSDQAFEPLDYVSDPMRHSKNLGLGLPLCRAIIQAHGGSIAAFSTNEFPAWVEIRVAVG